MARKEPLEISCSACDLKFRLWIPVDMQEWEQGARIACIRCGAHFLVKRGKEGFSASPLREPVFEKVPAASAPTPKPAHAQPPAPPQPAPRKEAAMPPPPPAPVSAPAPHAEPVIAKDSVLLVDDDRLAREMAEHTLKEAGISLISVKNANEALKLLWKGSSNIKLIVTDLYLKNPEDPESQIDGEELLKRAVDFGLTIPSIITTGKDIIDDLVLDPKWFDLRVKGFIQKGNPFWVDELKLKIKEVLYK